MTKHKRQGAWGLLSAAWRRRLICLGVLIALPTAAQALSCTADTGPVTFTDYKPSAALPKDISGYVDVRCTCSLDCIVLAYTVEIQGSVASPVSDRKMKLTTGSQTLKYSLYRDATRLLPFDVGSNGQGAIMALGGFGSPQRTFVYGRVPAAQNVPTGSYQDTPLVVVSY